MSRKRNYISYEVSTGGTEIIDTAYLKVGEIYLYGSATLDDDLIYSSSTNGINGDFVEFFYEATIVPNGSNLIIFDKQIPEVFLTIPFKAICRSNGTSWAVAIVPDFSQGNIITESDITDGSITNIKIADGTIELAKLYNYSQGSIITFDGSSAVELTIGADAQFLVSNGTDLQYVSMSGDATMDNAGVVTISPGALALDLQDAFDNGNTITIADTSNLSFWITNLDVTNNPISLTMSNASSGDMIYMQLTNGAEKAINIDASVNRTADMPIVYMSINSDVEQSGSATKVEYSQSSGLLNSDQTIVHVTSITSNASDHPNSEYVGHSTVYFNNGSDAHATGYLFSTLGTIADSDISIFGFRYLENLTHTAGYTYGAYFNFGNTYATTGNKYAMYITGAFDVGIYIDPVIVNTEGNQYIYLNANAGTKFLNGLVNISYSQIVALGNGDATFIKKSAINDINTDSATSYYYDDYNIITRTGPGTHYSKFIALNGAISAGASYGCYIIDTMMHTAGNVYGYYANFAGVPSAGTKLGLSLNGKMTTAIDVNQTQVGQGVKITQTINDAGHGYGMYMDLTNSGAGDTFAFSFNGDEAVYSAGHYTTIGAIDGKITIQIDGHTLYIPCYASLTA